MIDDNRYKLTNYNFKPILIGSLANYASGGKFIHSLLDNHHDIMTIPNSPPQFCQINKFNELSKEEIINQLFLFDEFFDSSNDQRRGRNKLGQEKNQIIKIDKYIFSQHLEEFLKINDWNILNYIYSVYLSYNFTNNTYHHQNFIAIYLHDIFFINEFSKIIINPIILCSVRLPINAFSTYVRNKGLKSKQFKKISKNKYLHFVYSFYEFEKIKNKIYCIVLEELHKNPQKSINKLCDKLNIPFDKNLLVSTFNGMLWFNPNKFTYNGFNYDAHKAINTKENDKLIIKFFFNIFFNFYQYFGYSNIERKRDKIKLPYKSLIKNFIKIIISQFLYTKDRFKIRIYFLQLKIFIDEIYNLKAETAKLVSKDIHNKYKSKLIIINPSSKKYF